MELRAGATTKMGYSTLRATPKGATVRGAPWSSESD